VARITIVREDNTVIVDGRALPIDCGPLAAAIHAVQWHGDKGHIEYVNPPGAPPEDFLPNAEIESLEPFQSVVNAWQAAADAIDKPPAPTLEQVKAAKLLLLRAKCAQQITSGFSSAALGSPHHYASDFISQANLTASVLNATLSNLPEDWTTPFWCTIDGKTWSFAEHTAEQIRQAGLDGKAWVVAAQKKLAGLRTQIDAAAAVDAVKAIDW